MHSSMANNAWYTSSPMDDFGSILRMIMDETSQFAVAAASLLSVLWSAVVVTAMLAEGILNVAIQATTDSACSSQQKTSIRMTVITFFALGLWWTYFGIVVGPVCSVIGRPSASIIRKLLRAAGAVVFG